MKTALSTEIFAAPSGIFAQASARRSKQFGVESELESLADYVRRIIKEKDLSYRVVAARSGGEVSQTTVSDIINRRVSDIKVQTLRDLALGLGVKEQELFNVAIGKKNPPPSMEESFAALDRLGIQSIHAYGGDFDEEDLAELVTEMEHRIEQIVKRKTKR